MSYPPIPEPAAELPVEALDIQHDTDPEEDHGPVRRIPNLAHALLFFSITMTSVLFFMIVAFSKFQSDGDAATAQHPGHALAAMTVGYTLALAASWRLFPVFWKRSFLHGIQWNVLAAHRRWFWIVPSAIALSFASQYADRFVNLPKTDPIELLMNTQRGAWAVTAFGVLLAPLMEEIAFRGFLLPALATAYDWLALERSPAGLRKWEATAGHTTPAIIFGVVFSSIGFALIHADQLSHAWAALGVIFAVGIVLSFVRVRTHSVACSALMHATYNLTIFAVVFYSTGGYHHMDKL